MYESKCISRSVWNKQSNFANAHSAYYHQSSSPSSEHPHIRNNNKDAGDKVATFYFYFLLSTSGSIFRCLHVFSHSEQRFEVDPFSNSSSSRMKKWELET